MLNKGISNIKVNTNKYNEQEIVPSETECIYNQIKKNQVQFVSNWIYFCFCSFLNGWVNSKGLLNTDEELMNNELSINYIIRFGESVTSNGWKYFCVYTHHL